MEYVLYNDSRESYVYYDIYHKICETWDIKRASIFDRNKANNVLLNSISPSDQYKWKVIEFKPPKCVSFCDINDISQNIANSEVMKLLSVIMDAAEKLNSYTNNLSEQLSEIDRQQQDILHFIESYDLNACEGFKIYKLLKQIRTERRQIKNEIKKASICDFSAILDVNYKGILKRMAQFDSQNSYTPRVLTELFETKKSESKSKIILNSEHCG